MLRLTTRLRVLERNRRVLYRAMSEKIKPNTDESSMHFDSYYESISDVPRSIISLDTNYCLINKPAHVRMSGNFTVTVEKLMLHWIKGIEIKDLKWIHQLDYATSGVLCVGLNRKAAGLASCSFASRDVDKQYLAVLQGHLNINDWPELTEMPVYNDIEEGGGEDVKPPGIHKRKHSNNTTITTTNDNTNNDNKNTVDTISSQPPVPTENTWQTEIMEGNLKRCYDAFMQWKHEHADTHITTTNTTSTTNNNHSNTNNTNNTTTTNTITTTNTAPISPSKYTFHQYREHNPKEWLAVSTIIYTTYFEFQKSPKFRKILRKFLRNCGIDIEIQESNHTSCPDLLNIQEQKKEEIINNISTELNITLEHIIQLRKGYLYPQQCGKGLEKQRIFRIKRNVPGGYRLVIAVPVAEIPGDFRMEPGHAGNPGKACLTELEVLSYGRYKGAEVTKVRLLPRTGRRHQLRIHTMCLGCPIVGDFTYNPFHREAAQAQHERDREHQVVVDTVDRVNIATTTTTTAADNTERVNSADVERVKPVDDTNRVAERMMLHAHRLRVNYYDGSAKAPSEALHPRLKTLLSDNFPPDSPCLHYKTQDLTSEVDGFFVSPEGIAEAVLVQGEAPDPFVLINDELCPIL